MFVGDVTQFDVTETLVSVARLHASKLEIETELLRHALHYADLCPGPGIPADQTIPGAEQSKVYGGPGCPGIGDFAPAEFGVVTDRSAGAAAKYIGQALALYYRLPLIWGEVDAGNATAWKACNIATACLGLSAKAAAIVDRKVAHIVDSVTPLRLANIVKAAFWEADPEEARAAAEEKARQRGVWAGRTDEYGTTTLFILAATGDVIRLDATITQIAEALAVQGDTGTLDQRRARAIGILADPELTYKLLHISEHLVQTRDDSTPIADPDASSEPATAAWFTPTEPSPDDEADRDAPAPSVPNNPFHTTEAAHQPGHAPQHPTTEPSPHQDPTPPSPAGTHSTQDHEPNQSDQTTPSNATPATGVDGATGTVVGTGLGTSAGAHAATDADISDDDRGSGAELLASLTGSLAAVRQSADGTAAGGSKPRRNRTVLYIHLAAETLLAGQGVARIEGFGPVLTNRLAELLGHDQIVVRPVIDLNQNISVDAYEIPSRIRERIKLIYPVEQFPFGTVTTTKSTDLDHINPFQPTGPPGQTSTTNLAPLGRYSHRVKTHGGWTVRRVDDHTLEWTTRHGFRFRVDQTGTHPLTE